jgi:hypothetical protein
LKAVAHPQLHTGKPEDLAVPELFALFMSLLGAVAYLAHTRIDVVVFVSALQRHTSKPQLAHIKRLNKLLSWVQRNPKKLAYRKLGGGSSSAEPAEIHLKAISDAAYKKETEDGYSLRGAVFTISEGKLSEATLGGNPRAHVIDWVCKSQRHVSRSTFASELLSAGDTVDQAIVISQMLYELRHGILEAQKARELRTRGGFIPIALYIDAKSVYAAITAVAVRVPTEKSLLAHVQYMRELLDIRVLKYLVWVDTRDMVADGLTKGAVDRSALHKLMDGQLLFEHELAGWSSKAN